jgi:hypothetical protein
MTSGLCRTCAYLSRLGRCQSTRSDHYAGLRGADDGCPHWSTTRMQVPVISGHVTAAEPAPVPTAQRRKISP